MFDPKREDILSYSNPYSTLYISRATTSASTCPPSLFTGWLISFTRGTFLYPLQDGHLLASPEKHLPPSPSYFCLQEFSELTFYF